MQGAKGKKSSYITVADRVAVGGPGGVRGVCAGVAGVAALVASLRGNADVKRAESVPGPIPS